MIGILAYGSLIDNPGIEIKPYILKTIEAITPFSVEFARSSNTRDGAPTLIPVSQGGSPVKAKVLVLDVSISELQARNMLWRREIGKIGSNQDYIPPNETDPDKVIIKKF